MKFIIDRVSGDTPPCEDAVLEEVTRTHTTCNPYGHTEQWLKKNNPTFRREGECIKWDVTFSRWTIEVNTLEELVALREKIGDDLILREGSHLEIYDDYM